MPCGDGTGPLGLGPMTGRAAGFCAGYPMPGYANPLPGRFWFWARFPRWGRGGWWGRWWPRRWAAGLPYGMPGLPYWAPTGWVPPQMSKEQGAEVLRQQADYLRSALDEITRRLEELSKEKEE